MQDQNSPYFPLRRRIGPLQAGHAGFAGPVGAAGEPGRVTPALKTIAAL